MSIFRDVLRAFFDRSSIGPHTTSEHTHPREISDDLRRWLHAAFAVDDDAQERRLIERMSADAARTVVDLESVYWSSGDEDASLRWAMVHCACRLNSPATAGFLIEVLEAEMPPEQSTDVHLHSTVAEEVSQRMRAIDGLTALLDRDESVADPLLRARRHPVFAVRASAYLALRDRVSDDWIDDSIVDADREELNRLRRIDVRELSEFGELERVDLPELAGPDEPRRRPSRRTPTISGESHG